MSTSTYAVDVAGLRKQFYVRQKRLGARPQVVHAVSDISFKLQSGQTLGIVGESGCGKSTLARLLMGLIEADDGSVLLAGQVLGSRPEQLAAVRRKVQMVFQDSFASLNPRLSIEASLMFGPQVHGVSRTEARQTAHELLARVGLEPARFAGRYPHEVSGGQRQRVNIARALALKPEIVIFDEAVSALDKSVELQVLNLLLDLKAEFGLTYLFISHDLNVVQYISDEVMVMYLGKVVEMGPVESVYAHPAHPYTRALLASMPSMDPRQRTQAAPIVGDPPSPIDPPSGCRFRTRCPHAVAACAEGEPLLRAAGSDGHRVACHLTLTGGGAL
ncbi:ABC transporter ATP-binding protein [Rhodoferax fermentans]|uniref:Glutathione import ATP-binding protein GsiA n=1 Tax=Rhodoferax fermentans TaxID=28066 RepID=A0A1T1ATX8_RHOFE|nr:oligopeptide/dipeptide ABC transporter ATP-binding protein [Rhodoferax fermentans]MBK1685003.1 dipeptide/oligopeptide/nickel ABC transporter ATP-binding protein [Rhodoferax fermentans]OOV07435.1 dipeptide/oligopeptide/nickel ABC transporter ATP-binding protein [Rhodoferax fermentans]